MNNNTNNNTENNTINNVNSENSSQSKDIFKLGKYEFTSRFILGSGKYSLELIDAAVKQAEAQIVTLALRRANDGGIANILDYIPKMSIFFLIHQGQEMLRIKNSKTFKRTLPQRYGKDRSYKRYKVPSSR